MFYVGKIIGSLVSNIINTTIGRSKTFALGAFLLGMVIYTEIISAWKADFGEEGREYALGDGSIKAIMVSGNIVAGFGAALIWVA